MEGKTDMKRLLNIAFDNAVALGVVVIVLFLIDVYKRQPQSLRRPPAVESS